MGYIRLRRASETEFVIVFAPSLCYPLRTMRRKMGPRSRSFAPALRGFLTAFLTVAYIVAGLAGEISCANDTLRSADQIEAGDVPTKGDQGSKKSVAVVDHCYTCAPLLLPAPVFVVEPAAERIPPAFATPTFLLVNHAGLDTPPPKHLT